MTDMVNKKTNVVIPIAGRGQRFLDKGITTPKPFISVKGKTLLEWSLKSIFLNDKNLIFICLDEQRKKYNIGHYLIEKFGIDIKVIFLKGVTGGQACSVLTAKKNINNNSPLIILNGDQYIVSPFERWVKEQGSNYDGVIPVFKSSDPRYSFVKVDNNNIAVEVAEKKAISNWATAGLYYFKQGNDFVWAAEEMIKKNIRHNNEFYVCPAYQQLIESQRKITMLEIEKLWCMGTPEELADFERKFKL